jgi:hypothetical protein
MTLETRIQAEMVVDEPDISTLVEVVRPYVRIGDRSGRLITTERYASLPPGHNAAAYLLAAHARSRYLDAFGRSVDVSGLELATGLREGDIRRLDFAHVEGAEVSLTGDSINGVAEILQSDE